VAGVDDDPWQDPGYLEYAKRCIDDLLPKVQQSGICMSLVPKGPADVKYAVELGFMIMLDKPIISVVFPGAKVPEKLARVSDEIVEGDINDPNFGARISEAIIRVQKARGDDD
jgi:hypothetical protein